MKARRPMHASPRWDRWFQRVTGPIGATVLGAAALATLLLGLYGPDSSLSLLAWSFVDTMIGLSVLGLLIGLSGRSVRWWITWGAGIALGAVAVVAILWWWLGASGAVDQGYPPTFLVWGWACLFALGVAATGWWSGPAIVRVARVITVPFILFASFLLINLHYGYWPTMGDLLHRPLAGEVSSRSLKKAIERSQPSRIGKYGEVEIPSPKGFDGGKAYVWIPPGYDKADRADLPVLLMLPGWPGDAENWARAGQVLPLANAWARAHDGVAPVLVFVSGNGADDKDTECVNASQGPAYTYLTQQVPDFITQVLGISRDPARWGTVGFSEGGTCALELATKDPGTYGRFVDISGELVPSYGPDGDHAYTLKYLYDGDETALLHDSAMWLFTHYRYGHSVGWFTAGSGDAYHERIAAELTAAAKKAGAKAYDTSGGSGGHSWSYAHQVFVQIYPHLVQAMPTVKGPAGGITTLGPLVIAKVKGAGAASERLAREAARLGARRRHRESVATGLPVETKEQVSFRPIECATGPGEAGGPTPAACTVLGYGGTTGPAGDSTADVAALGWRGTSVGGTHFLLGAPDLTGRGLRRVKVETSAADPRRSTVVVTLTAAARAKLDRVAVPRYQAANSPDRAAYAGEEAVDLSGTVVVALRFDQTRVSGTIRISCTRDQAKVLAAELNASR